MDGQREPLKPPDDDEPQTSSEEVPEAAGGGSRRMLLVSLAVLLWVVGAGVSVAVLSSPGDDQVGFITGRGPGGSQAGHAASADNSPAVKASSARPTAPSASSPPVGGADVTSNGVAKSALQWPPQLEHRMVRWWAGSGGATLTAVEAHMGNAMQAAGLKFYSPMSLACTTLASDINTAQAGPPIPYAAMQRLYARALDGLSVAAADCRAAISVHANGEEDIEVHLDKVLLNRSRAEFAAMSKKLYTATAEVQALGR
jgi:hypothetical protein